MFLSIPGGNSTLETVTKNEKESMKVELPVTGQKVADSSRKFLNNENKLKKTNKTTEPEVHEKINITPVYPHMKPFAVHEKINITPVYPHMKPIAVHEKINITPVHPHIKQFAVTNSITPPLCGCGRRCKRKKVMNPGPNIGRVFYSCPIHSHGSDDGCGFFAGKKILLKISLKRKNIPHCPGLQLDPFWNEK